MATPTLPTPPYRIPDTFLSAMMEAIGRYNQTITNAGYDPRVAAEQLREIWNSFWKFVDSKRRKFMAIATLAFLTIIAFLVIQIQISLNNRRVFDPQIAWYTVFVDVILALLTLMLGGREFFFLLVGSFIGSGRKKIETHEHGEAAELSTADAIHNGSITTLKVLVGFMSVFDMIGLVFGIVPYWISVPLIGYTLAFVSIRLKSGFITGKPLKIFEHIRDWSTDALIISLVVAFVLRYGHDMDPNSWGQNPVVFTVVFAILAVVYRLIFRRSHDDDHAGHGSASHAAAPSQAAGGHAGGHSHGHGSKLLAAAGKVLVFVVIVLLLCAPKIYDDIKNHQFYPWGFHWMLAQMGYGNYPGNVVTPKGWAQHLEQEQQKSNAKTNQHKQEAKQQQQHPQQPNPAEANTSSAETTAENMGEPSSCDNGPKWDATANWQSNDELIDFGREVQPEQVVEVCISTTNPDLRKNFFLQVGDDPTQRERPNQAEVGSGTGSFDFRTKINPNFKGGNILFGFDNPSQVKPDQVKGIHIWIDKS